MAIVAGLDLHRAQITFDALDRETGEVRRGRIRATPEAVASGWKHSRAPTSTSRSRRARARCLCARGAPSRISQSPQRRARCAAQAQSEDRPRGRPLAADCRLSASRESVRCAGIDIRSIAPTAAPEPASRPSRLAAAALGALRVGPGGLPSDQSRPGRLPPAPGRRSHEERAAGVVPRGTTHQSSRRRRKGRAPR